MIKRKPRKNLRGDLVNRGNSPNVDFVSNRIRRKPDCFRSYPAPMRIGAIVTVCTRALFHELREWLPSARHHFPGRTLYVATDVSDEQLQRMANSLFVENVKKIHLDLEYAKTRISKVNVWAAHWILEAIWGKLFALKTAVEFENDGVLLADCDITFNAPPYRERYFADVVLSPNFHGDLQLLTRNLGGTEKIPLYVRDSLFNAGMLATRSVDFCNWWIEQYEAGGPNTFVEQTALEQVPRLFDVDYFGPEENFGKWRFAAPPPNTNSFHMHIKERSRRPDVTMLKIAAQSAAAKSRSFLKSHPDKRK